MSKCNLFRNVFFFFSFLFFVLSLRVYRFKCDSLVEVLLNDRLKHFSFINSSSSMLPPINKYIIHSSVGTCLNQTMWLHLGCNAMFKIIFFGKPPGLWGNCWAVEDVVKLRVTRGSNSCLSFIPEITSVNHSLMVVCRRTGRPKKCRQTVATCEEGRVPQKSSWCSRFWWRFAGARDSSGVVVVWCGGFSLCRSQSFSKAWG